MTSENRAQKLHTDDVSLPRSGWCFWLVVPRGTRIWVVMRHQYGTSALVSQTSFRGKPLIASRNVAGCFLRPPFKWKLLSSAFLRWCHNDAQCTSHFETVHESLTIRAKATEPCFPVVMFIRLYRLVLATECVVEVLKCDHSNASNWLVLQRSDFC